MAEAAAKAEEDVINIKDMVSADEWRLRVELAAAYRVTADYGWDDLLITHFSARGPGENKQFLLKSNIVRKSSFDIQ